MKLLYLLYFFRGFLVTVVMNETNCILVLKVSKKEKIHKKNSFQLGYENCCPLFQAKGKNCILFC